LITLIILPGANVIESWLVSQRRDAVIEQENLNWEAELQRRTNELLAQRFSPLKSELERLQTAFNETHTRLLEQAQAPAGAEEQTALTEHVQQLLASSVSQAEQQLREGLTAELEQQRNEAVAAARQEAEAEFEQQRVQIAETLRSEAAAEYEQRQAELVQNVRQEAETEFEQRRAEIVEAVRQEAEADFQKRLEQSCTEAAAVARREADAQLEDLREQLEVSRQALTAAVAAQQPPAPPPPAAPNYNQIKTAIEEIDAQRTQSEVLTALINRAAYFAPRVVFFVVKGGDAVGWKTGGFDNGLTDETVRSLAVSAQASTMVGEALNLQRTAIRLTPQQADVATVLGRFSHPVPQGMVAVPLVVRGKAAAVLYADSGTQTDDAIHLEAIEALMQVTGMAIELLPTRRGAEAARPAPAASQSVSAQAGAMHYATAAPSAVESAPYPAVSARSTEEAAGAAAYVEPAFDRAAAEASQTAGVSEFVAREAAGEERVSETARQKLEYYVEPPSFREDEPAPTPSKYDTQETPVPAALKPAAPPAEMPPWVQRLQEVAPEEAPPSLPAAAQVEAPKPDSPTWPLPEDSFQQEPPAPPLPPPVRVTANDRAAAPTAPFTPEEDLQPPSPSETPAPRLAEAPSEIRPPSLPLPPEAPRYHPPSLSAMGVATETEVRAHNDARRFARLLVSEIKLYNAAKVNEGRRHADLYDRLHEEIDRSRKVYDKRVSPAVAAKFDYFYDELVQTLAEGDPAKLGESCPGPLANAS
jgi:hypothetical protein